LVFSYYQFTQSYCKKCGNKYEIARGPMKNLYYNNNKWCKACQINYLKDNFVDWTSGNEKIDSLIQEKQLCYDMSDKVFEWIPYNKLFNVKEIEDNCLTKAIWKDGPLEYDIDEEKWIREPYGKVCLRYLHNLEDITDEFINKISDVSNVSNVYFSDKHKIKRYGVSQNPDTNAYILVFEISYLKFYCEKCGNKYEIVNELPYRYTYSTNYKWCKPCQINYSKNNFKNWTSGNEKIDSFIQNKQLKSTIFEWISYNRLNDIKETRKNDFATAIWEDGPLYYNGREFKRKSNEKVLLKYLYCSQNINNIFLNEVRIFLLFSLIINNYQHNYLLYFNRLHI
jgi:hypothetical protein